MLDRDLARVFELLSTTKKRPDATMTLNRYSHVLDPGELPQASLEALFVWSPSGLEEA